MNKPELSKKKPLTPEQIADAARLLALWEAWQETRKIRGDPFVSQGKFAQTHGLGTQGNLWQYTNAKTPLNIRAAMSFAEGLGCKIEDFSPTLAAKAHEIGAYLQAPKPSAFADLASQRATPGVDFPSSAEVFVAFKDQLPESLRVYAEQKVTISEQDFEADYLSPDLSVGVVVVREGVALKNTASTTLLLQLIQRVSPQSRPHLIVVSLGKPRDLPKIVQVTCRLCGIALHRVSSGEAAALLVAELETVPELEEPFD